jgi:hypothetical protein
MLLFAAAHAADNPLSLQIAAPDETAVETNASLKVTITNTSSRSITLVESNLDATTPSASPMLTAT